MGSEHAVVLHTFDLVGVLAAEWFVDVVGVGGVLGALLLVAVVVALSNNLFAGDLVLLHHLDGENVIDFNVMG